MRKASDYRSDEEEPEEVQEQIQEEAPQDESQDFEDGEKVPEQVPALSSRPPSPEGPGSPEQPQAGIDLAGGGVEEEEEEEEPYELPPKPVEKKKRKPRKTKEEIQRDKAFREAIKAGIMTEEAAIEKGYKAPRPAKKKPPKEYIDLKDVDGNIVGQVEKPEPPKKKIIKLDKNSLAQLFPQSEIQLQLASDFPAPIIGGVSHLPPKKRPLTKKEIQLAKWDKEAEEINRHRGPNRPPVKRLPDGRIDRRSANWGTEGHLATAERMKKARADKLKQKQLEQEKNVVTQAVQAVVELGKQKKKEAPPPPQEPPKPKQTRHNTFDSWFD